jgi:hypothetical protein
MKNPIQPHRLLLQECFYCYTKPQEAQIYSEISACGQLRVGTTKSIQEKYQPSTDGVHAHAPTTNSTEILMQTL